MAKWDTSQYLKFASERMRAPVDLLGRVPLEAPRTVYDLGCGAGNVTRLLAGRWPEARITGIDSSPEMLTKAREEGAAIDWVEAALEAWRPEEPADLLFSNAALHWLDDHAALFPRLMSHLAPGGVLAVQMPRNHAEPAFAAIAETVRSGPWAARLEPILRPAPVAAPAVYYRLLAPLAERLEIWETVYHQILTGENPVVEFGKGSVLRPLLDALGAAEKEAFLGAYAERVAAAYPPEPDGRTIYPFRRLFLVAARAG